MTQENNDLIPLLSYFPCSYGGNESKKISINDVWGDNRVYYQLNYEPCYVACACNQHEQLYWYLQRQGADIETIKYSDFIKKRFDYEHKRSKNICEILYCYGNGGQWLIIRHLSMTEVIKGLYDSTFCNYKNGDSWIEERNFNEIKKHKLSIKNIKGRINYATQFITNLSKRQIEYYTKNIPIE